MSFTDLFKNSVVEGFTNADISLSKILVTLGITVVLALYIFAIYRLATKSVFYSKGFAISMAAISVITAAILIAMQSNLVISLGMVGALSIVRFRTAIKDPMDLLFLFWSIGVGIICGAGLYRDVYKRQGYPPGGGGGPLRSGGGTPGGIRGAGGGGAVPGHRPPALRPAEKRQAPSAAEGGSGCLHGLQSLPPGRLPGAVRP